MVYSDPRQYRFLGIIPARYASTRFPGKPLVDINGRSMILRVYDQARLSGVFQDIVVATDDNRILERVVAEGYNAVMTSTGHHSGTDRCLEAHDIYSNEQGSSFDFIINIQGDEPFLPPENILQVAGLLKTGEVEIASLIKKIQNREDIFNPNVVKAVFNSELQAMYFSRAPVPYLRETSETQWGIKRAHFKHIGIYGYKTGVLREICQLPVGRLEQLESLEQLRWLEAGFRMQLGITELESISIDTPEDLLKITNTL